jgi:hypothetical protein
VVLKKTIKGSFLILSLLLGCAKNELSDRDIKKSQLTNDAEIKRRELLLVAGTYPGQMVQSNGITQVVLLTLEVKDIPTVVEGQIDPIMIPILTGYLKMFLGSGANPNEFIGFAVQKAEFDPNTEKLDLVLTHVDYKELLFALVRKEPTLNGNWTAPALSLSGTAALERKVGVK